MRNLFLVYSNIIFTAMAMDSFQKSTTLCEITVENRAMPPAKVEEITDIVYNYTVPRNNSFLRNELKPYVINVIQLNQPVPHATCAEDMSAEIYNKALTQLLRDKQRHLQEKEEEVKRRWCRRKVLVSTAASNIITALITGIIALVINYWK